MPASSVEEGISHCEDPMVRMDILIDGESKDLPIAEHSRPGVNWAT